jgi:hypothetical protein
MYFGFFSASWINQIERFFGLLTENQIRRGVFQSVDDLKQAITRSSMPTTKFPSHSNGSNQLTTSSPISDVSVRLR